MAEKMVRSLLDTDVYKFTTSYAYMKKYPDAEGEFSFIDRNNTEFSIDEIDDLLIIEELNDLFDCEGEW